MRRQGGVWRLCIHERAAVLSSIRDTNPNLHNSVLNPSQSSQKNFATGGGFWGMKRGGEGVGGTFGVYNITLNCVIEKHYLRLNSAPMFTPQPPFFPHYFLLRLSVLKSNLRLVTNDKHLVEI